MESYRQYYSLITQSHYVYCKTICVTVVEFCISFYIYIYMLADFLSACKITTLMEPYFCALLFKI